MLAFPAPAYRLSLPFFGIEPADNSCVRTGVAGLLLLFACVSPGARADIFTFVDESGTAHFSNVPNDPRYQVLIAAAAEGTRAGEHIAADVVLANARRYEHMIESAAARVRIEAQLLRAVIAVESGYNARAVSRAGARGLMQLMPDTARRYGVRNVFDPAQNIHGGARYLRYLLDRYGQDKELALAAYNAGEGAVERHGRKVPPFAETRLYVPRVLGIYRALLGGRRDPAHGVTAIHHRGSGDFPPPPTGCCLPPLPAAVAYLAITSRPPSPVA